MMHVERVAVEFKWIPSEYTHFIDLCGQFLNNENYGNVSCCFYRPHRKSIDKNNKTDQVFHSIPSRKKNTIKLKRVNHILSGMRKNRPATRIKIEFHYIEN